MEEIQELKLEFPPKLECLFLPKRYKVLYGGRGSAKSWSAARALIVIMLQRPIRVLCAREVQNSIQDSVHKLLKDQIYAMQLGDKFDIQQNTIICTDTGGDFRFEGIRNNINKIKSYEGVDICWVEEAQSITKNSWDVLIPTIRKAGSEIWITFNPDLESDETYQRFVKDPPRESFVVEINWRDNPWFGDILRAEMEETKRRSYQDYLWIWEGKCRVMLDGAVYSEELMSARGEKRICKVPYDPFLGVHVFFDLGWNDATALWFVQRGRNEVRYINYYENRQKKLEHYLTYIQAQGWPISYIWLPHDAKAGRVSGPTEWEIVGKKGFQRKLVPRLRIAQGINAARTIFPISYFDEERCEVGLKALMHYRYKIDEDTKTFSKEPLHDWASHGADGFRYSAIGLAAARPEGPRSIRAAEEAQEVEDWGQWGGQGPGNLAGPTGWMK